MAHISVQDLQKIAVEVTSDFYHKGIPLSEGLAKQASQLELNSDQVKRAIEATNTLAYLKSVESDRTSEFPLADYDQIMKCASIPEGMDMTKAASLPDGFDPGDRRMGHYVKTLDDQGFPINNVEDELKDSQEETQPKGVCYETEESYEMPAMTKQAEMALLIKEAAKNKRALDDANARAFHLEADMFKTAAELAKTEHAVEALSYVAKGDQFTKLARLTFGTENTPTALDWVSEVKVPFSWKPALEKAAKLDKMLIQAQDTVAEIQKRSGMDKQANLIFDAAKAVGSAASKVITAPFKFAGNRVANSISAGVDTMATKAQTGFAGTGLGKAMGIKPTTVTAKTQSTLKSQARLRGGAMLAGGVALDAAAFTPTNDPTRGKNGDVWDALN
jgi:DNA-binding transcriptional MerR regulator